MDPPGSITWIHRDPTCGSTTGWKEKQERSSYSYFKLFCVFLSTGSIEELALLKSQSPDHPLIIPTLLLDYPQNYPWIFHGISMDNPWVIPRKSLGYPRIIPRIFWIFPRLSLDYPWIFHGFPMNNSWINIRLSLDYFGIFLCLSLAYPLLISFAYHYVIP